MKRIAIIGATGLIGKPVTQELLNAGFNITIIARDIEKARNYFPNTNIIYGDLEDKSSLFSALKGQELLYLNLHVTKFTKPTDFITETDGLLNLIEAAKFNNIQRITYLSSLVKNYQGQNNFKWWVFDAKQKAVQLIKSSNIPYTIFYSSIFMETLDKGGLLNGNKLNLPGKSKFKIFWISAKDYGKLVAKSFDLLTDENREYNVQGPQAFLTDEAVNLFVENYSLRKLKVVKIPVSLIKMLGKISLKYNYGYHFLEALNKHQEKFISQFTWDELGMPKETLKDYTLRIQIELSDKNK